MAERNWEAELKAMADKNAELIGEVRDAGKKLKAFEDIDLDALKTAAVELETLKVAKQEEVGEYKTLYETEIAAKKKLASDLEAANGTVKSMTKRQKIGEVLPTRTIPVLRDLAIDQLYQKSKLESDGSVTVEGIPVQDFVKSWQESAIGKHFIAAEDNTGGGAPGSRNLDKDEALKFFRKDKSTYNMTEVGKIQKSDPERADKLRKAAEKLATDQ